MGLFQRIKNYFSVSVADASAPAQTVKVTTGTHSAINPTATVKAKPAAKTTAKPAAKKAVKAPVQAKAAPKKPAPATLKAKPTAKKASK